MESAEAEGDSIDTAINAALTRLGTTRDRVDIEILANASRGLFGIGGRKARVRATVRAPISAEAAVPVIPAVMRRPAPPAPAERHSDAAPGADGVGERAAKILADIVEHIGVDARVEVRREEDHLLLELTGDSSGVLIGRRGQMLDALEYVLNRIVGRDDTTQRLRVDSQNYRARRHSSLEEMARRMGEQAKKKGRPVSLNPMSPHDRRIVHLVLQADGTLTTKSAGKGYFRRLIIIPDGASKPARPPR